MPVARWIDGLRDAAPEQSQHAPQPRVGRLDELLQDDRRGRPLGEPGRLAGVAALIDPADHGVLGEGQRIVLGRPAVRVATGIHRREIVERRLPGRVLGEWPGARLLQPAKGLVERRAERSVDRHDLARRLHLRPEPAVGGRELVEREPRQLDDDVVERRLERGDGRAGDHVRDLRQRPPDRDLRRDPGDRVAGRLRGQRGRA